MKDYYLKFDDQAQAESILFDVQNGVQMNKFRNTDVIGIIYNPTGNQIIIDGVEMPEMAPIPGWHVNVRCVAGEDGAMLEPYRVYPTAPRRVWA